jgi:hypothetical protein
MDSDSWARLSTSSRRYNSRSDLFHVGDEIDGDEERTEFMCPFCAEDFDMVGLCCHIDEEHPVEYKTGVCPVCAKRVGMDFVGHITMQHGSLLKVQRKRRLRRGGSGNSTLSILRKELREGNLRSLIAGSSSCFNTEPDPWLSSFMCNPPLEDQLSVNQTLDSALADLSLSSSSSVNPTPIPDVTKRTAEQHQLSGKEQEEKARKCKFVQGLVLSTFLDDDDDF